MAYSLQGPFSDKRLADGSLNPSFDPDSPKLNAATFDAIDEALVDHEQRLDAGTLTREVESGVLLGAGATYEGESLNVGTGGTITGRAVSDKAFTIRVEESSDGATWTAITADVASDTVDGDEKAHVVGMTMLARIRLVVVNTAGSAQTSFELIRQVTTS